MCFTKMEQAASSGNRPHSVVAQNILFKPDFYGMLCGNLRCSSGQEGDKECAGQVHQSEWMRADLGLAIELREAAWHGDMMLTGVHRPPFALHDSCIPLKPATLLSYRWAPPQKIPTG